MAWKFSLNRWLVVTMVMGFLSVLSCQQKPSPQPETQSKPLPTTEQKTSQPAKASENPAQQTEAQARDMQAFAQQKGCFSCHGIDEKKVGPSFKQVAKAYAKKQHAEEHIAEFIRKGGVGEWGKVPMPPQNVTEGEALELARWVLSLK